MRGLRVTLGALALVACSAERQPNGSFSSEDPGQARPYLVLKQGRDTSAKGWPGTEIHIGLMVGASDADQRATLQHVIDSVARKDTAVFWLRVTGFAPGAVVPGKLNVDLHPVLQAIWAPPDTTNPASRSHGAVHRTYFTAITATPDTSKKR